MTPASCQRTIDDLPNKVLVDGIFAHLSQADRLNQQRTCRRWNQLMPFDDECLQVIPLIQEMLSLLHRKWEEKTEYKKIPLLKKRNGKFSSHDFDECKAVWLSKGPKIMADCLKYLLESKKLKSIRHLWISDKSGIWTTSEECVKVIVSTCVKLESLNISGPQMLLAAAAMELLSSLDTSKFPASLRELSIAVYRYHDAEFRLDSLSECRENLVKLHIYCTGFDQNLMFMNEYFRNLTEFVASNNDNWGSANYSTIDPASICASHPNLTALCFGFWGLPTALVTNYLL